MFRYWVDQRGENIWYVCDQEIEGRDNCIVSGPYETEDEAWAIAQKMELEIE